MSLLRTKIRETLLAKCSALTEYRVLNNPVYPLTSQDLPALTVTLEKETLVPDASTVSKEGISIHTYEMPVVIEGVLEGSDNFHRRLEDCALQVMTLFQDDVTLGGLCKTLRWDSGVDLIAVGEAEQPIGRMRLAGAVLYRAAENAPDTPCD